VRRAEWRLGSPDAVARALDRFAEAFRQPGRYLDVPLVSQPGLELAAARDDLEEVLRRLPAGARADLGRLVRRIDAEYERRTLPDPHVRSGWGADRWWWRRVSER
jgi:hypothetical protein